MPKLMLVEDDNNLREIYEARLQAEGYDIVTAHDGEEALVVAKAEQPELIISDVMMPKISGFEMLDILRNTDGLKDVKIIMLTALGQSDDQQRADRLGADAYLVKSQVTLEDIVKVAERLLGGEETEEAPAEAAAEPAAIPEPVAAPAPVAAAIPEPAPAPQPTPEIAMPQPMAMPQPIATPAPVDVPAAEPVAVTPQPPAPEPVVTPAPQVELPTPQPAPVQQPEPVVQEQPEPAMAFEMTPVPENQVPQTSSDAVPTSEEVASVQAQIEQFANEVAATAPEVEPAPVSQQPPAEAPAPEVPQAPAPAPQAPEQYLTTAAPDLTSAVPPAAPAPQSAGNDDVLATAIESLTGVPASPAPAIWSGAVAATVPGPNAPAKGGERVIAPLNTPSRPDINTLLSLEQAKEQAPGSTIAVPEGTVNPVVQPGPAPQNNQPAPQNAPGEVIDPNSIAL